MQGLKSKVLNLKREKEKERKKIEKEIKRRKKKKVIKQIEKKDEEIRKVRKELKKLRVRKDKEKQMSVDNRECASESSEIKKNKEAGRKREMKIEMYSISQQKKESQEKHSERMQCL